MFTLIMPSDMQEVKNMTRRFSKVRILREAMSLTQADLAILCGVSVPTIRLCEQSGDRGVSTKVKATIAEVLGVQAEEIFGDPE